MCVPTLTPGLYSGVFVSREAESYGCPGVDRGHYPPGWRIVKRKKQEPILSGDHSVLHRHRIWLPAAKFRSLDLASLETMHAYLVTERRFELGKQGQLTMPEDVQWVCETRRQIVKDAVAALLDSGRARRCSTNPRHLPTWKPSPRKRTLFTAKGRRSAFGLHNTKTAWATPRDFRLKSRIQATLLVKFVTLRIGKLLPHYPRPPSSPVRA